jgi:hypothetical protein
MSTLSERAILTTLNVSQWTARKLDRSETSALNRSHGLNIEAARVNKNLLPFATELQRLQQVTGSIRKDFDRHTLPWGIDGMRILKSDAYLDFVQMVRHWQDDWESARDEFLDAYPVLQADARRTLGSLYKSDDYPDTYDLKRLFRFDIRFMPIADARDWRIDVGDEARQRLEADITARLQEVENNAMAEAWARVHDVVEKTVERLGNPTHIFRDSLIDNAIELTQLLPSLNITNDAEMEGVRQTIERTLAKFSGRVDDLRHDPIERQSAAEAMAAIQLKMAGYIIPKAA